MSELFDRLAGGYDAYANDAIGYRLPRAVHAELASRLLDARVGLDVGVGTGLLSELMRSASGIRVVGVDCSERMLRRALDAERVERVCRADVAASGLPFRSRVFDVTVGCGVTEFVSPLRVLVDEMARVTKVGGVVGLTYELATNGSGLQVHEIEPVPCYAYRTSYFEDVAEDAGLTVISRATVVGYVLDGVAVRHGVVVFRRSARQSEL